MSAIRRNVLQDAQARGEFVRGLKLLQREIIEDSLSTYDFFVIWHHQAMMIPTPVTQGRRNAAHVGPVFLPWHRFFLIVLEQQLQRVLENPDFGLPYWAWHVDGDRAPEEQKSADVWGAECLGGEGDPVSTGPFAFDPADPESWYVRIQPTIAGGLVTVRRGLRREFGSGPAWDRLPTSADVLDAMSKASYDEAPWLDSSQTTFRNLLEGWGEGSARLHNLVHMWVGGDMGPSTSPNDPVFFLNHCNVDRIWAAWQARYPTSPYLPPATESPELAGHRANDVLWAPFANLPTVQDMLDVTSVYSYDTFNDISGT
jgi:tyrosinase